MQARHLKSRFDRDTFSADLVAGLTFAIVNIPQAMANAVLVNINPILGLYTLMIATPIAALTTGSVFMNVSTTSALSVAAGDSLALVPDNQRVPALATLVLLTGIIQLLMGIFRLGSLLRFVSKSVMVGFITGVAALIILGQVSNLTGYDSGFSNDILQVAATLVNFDEISWPTFIAGLLTIGLIVLFNYTRLRKLSMVLSLAIVTIAVAVVWPVEITTVADIITVPEGGLFNPALPDLSLAGGLMISAFAIAIVGLVQGAGVSQNYPNPDGKYGNVSRDFVGQGLANIGTSFLQGIPAGGSMSGTAVTVNSGARSRLANVFAGVLVLPLALILSNFISMIPMTSLAGLLIVVGFQSFKPSDVVTVWQTNRVAQIAMALTFITTLILPLQFAVFVGVAVSILLHVFRSSNKVTVQEIVPTDGAYPIAQAPPQTLPDDAIVLLYVRGSVFFASATTFEAQLPIADKTKHSVVILILWGHDEIGSTFIGVLERYLDVLHRGGGSLMLAGVHERVHMQLVRTGMADKIGRTNIFKETPELGLSANQAYEQAKRWMAESAAAGDSSAESEPDDAGVTGV